MASGAAILDVDGDGIPYRTLPGTDHPFAAYFARGTGHNDMAVYSERSDDWVENMVTGSVSEDGDRAQAMLPQPIVEDAECADIGIISFGTNDDAIQRSARLADERRYQDRLSALAGLCQCRTLSVSDFINALQERFCD